MIARTRVPKPTLVDDGTLWVVYRDGSDHEIERRLANSPQDAPRIIALLACSHEQFVHGDCIRVLSTKVMAD
jgi:hypothetical protein